MLDCFLRFKARRKEMIKHLSRRRRRRRRSRHLSRQREAFVFQTVSRPTTKAPSVGVLIQRGGVVAAPSHYNLELLSLVSTRRIMPASYQIDPRKTPDRRR
jgi:hypothetical protein